MSTPEPVPPTPTLALALLLLVAFAPSAAAHEDVTAAAGIVEVAPGESANIPVEVHYHRLVGRVSVLDDAGGPGVALRVHGPGDAPPQEAGAGTDFRVNTVVKCCIGEFWTPHVLEVRNLGAEAVRVRVDLSLVHDNMAVLADDAESGAVMTSLAIFGGVSVAAWVRSRRAPLGTGGAFPWAVASTGAFVVLWAAAAAIGIVGSSRFGGSLVAGLLAWPADLPRMASQFVNTQALVIMGFMLVWSASLLLWAEAARRADVDRHHVARLGLMLGAGALAGCVLWGVEEGTVLVPILLAVATAAVPLWGGSRMAREAADAAPA